MNIQPLLDLLITQDDRNKLIDLLENISRSFFKPAENTINLLNSNKEFGPALLSILPSNFQNNDPRINSQLITGIIKSVKSIPSTQVVLAKSPTPEAINSVKQFMDENFPSKSIMSIKVDPEILGGAIVISEGKYIDMSVSKKLSDTFDASRGSIKKILEI